MSDFSLERVIFSFERKASANGDLKCLMRGASAQYITHTEHGSAPGIALPITKVLKNGKIEAIGSLGEAGRVTKHSYDLAAVIGDLVLIQQVTIDEQSSLINLLKDALTKHNIKLSGM